MFRTLLDFFKRKGIITIQNNYLKIALMFFTLFWYAASGYLYFETRHKPDLSWADSIWWTLVTMTTVGYGDFFPQTAGGRYFVGIPAMIFGIGFLGFIISEVASKLIESNSRRTRGMIQIESNDHIIIINFNILETILTLINELKSDAKTKYKNICLIDETLEELPKELLDAQVQFVKGNPTNENILNQANLKKASHVIILSKDPKNPHSDDQNLSNTLIIEKMKSNIFSIVEVINPQKIHQIELAGCDSVICVSELTTNLIIQELQDPGVKNVISELTSNSYGQQIYIVSIDRMKNYDYKELVLWGLKNNYILVGLLRDFGVELNCVADAKINKNDKAILIGNKRIKKITTA